jgi:outer membrane immunogenic protein
LLAAAAAACLFASPALAQGSATPAAPAGFRVEAIAGLDHPSIDGQHADGLLYGAGVGFDLPVAQSVSIGLDGEISSSTAKKDGLKAGRDFYAGGRVSFAVSPRLNLYAKGGYTNGRVKYLSGSSGMWIISSTSDLDGFRAGAGAEYRVAGNAYVGAEYRYSNYKQDFDRNQAVLTVGTHF